MLYAALASLLLVFHFAFLAFVVAGALLVLRWPRVAWAHLTAAIYPSGLTRPIEVALGTVALLGNVALYAWVLQRRRRAKPANQLRP